MQTISESSFCAVQWIIARFNTCFNIYCKTKILLEKWLFETKRSEVRFGSIRALQYCRQPILSPGRKGNIHLDLKKTNKKNKHYSSSYTCLSMLTWCLQDTVCSLNCILIKKYFELRPHILLMVNSINLTVTVGFENKCEHAKLYWCYCFTNLQQGERHCSTQL